MNEKLDKELVKTFPLLYKDRRANMRETCMCWGFECGDGWFKLIWDLSAKLESEINKLKEKNEKPIFLNNQKELWNKFINWLWRFIWYKCKFLFALRFKIARMIMKWTFSVHFDPEFLPRASQVKEKFGCYDEETECLTKDGWKFFKDITKNDLIATLKDDTYLEYQNPEDVISYPYQGKMYYLKTRGVNLLVTPNHNLYVAKGTYYNGKYSPPKKVEYPFELASPLKYFGKNKRFLKSCIWQGQEEEIFILPEYKYQSIFGFDLPERNITKNLLRTYFFPEKRIPMLAWLEFLGFYVAEGCSDKKRGSVSITCCNTDNGEEKEYAISLIKAIGFDYKVEQEDCSALTLRIYSKQLALWLLDHAGHLAPNKKVPNFIKELSPVLIERFLIGLYAGDAHQAKTSHILTTVSSQLANDAQELILKSGQTSYCFQRRKIRITFINDKKVQGNYLPFEVNWLRDSNCHNTQNKGLSKTSREEWINYNGQVYCVTVPNHVIMIRRRGIPVWCGNSLRFYMTSSNDLMDKYINEAENISARTCEKCGEPGTLNNYGWISCLCDKCRGYNLKEREAEFEKENPDL